MPLRLKQLELHGYKTFATKSEFAFSEGISAIVGPNGSGKSNIVDSIRWVLGEQSFGLLRGKKTEDMIFAGSELRPRAGMAQATLTFDNTDGWLPIDFTEVSIARRAYRDGQNEYLLNGQRVRLRDISELLAKCGLAERTYTIIGQGLIDTALSLKADERRALFEEAAGIGVYRNKREDALRKLESTQHNLERVLDILAEIKPRLRSLERQAQRMRDYQQVKDDLKAILKLWYGFHWYKAVAELAEVQSSAQQTETELAVMQGRQMNYDQEVAGLRSRLAHLRSQLNHERQESARLQGETETLARELAVADERLRSLAAQRAALADELPTLEAQLADQTERAAAAQADTERLRVEVSEAERQTGAAQAALAGREGERAALRQQEAEAQAALARLEALAGERRARQAQQNDQHNRLEASLAEQRLAWQQLQAAEARARATVLEANAYLDRQQQARAEAEAALSAAATAARQADTDLATATQRQAAAQAEAERLRARHDVLEQARAQLSGFSAGARTLLGQSFPTRGALAELLDVPAELETAVGAALGAYLDALVVDDFAQAEAALSALGVTNGRAALLPLDRLKAPAPLTPPAHADVLGVAANLVQAPEWLQPAARLLLGHAIIVRDGGTARRLLGGEMGWTAPAHAALVTLAGEVYHAGGPVLAGREAAPTTLEQARERRDLAAELEALTQRLAEREAEREAAAQAVTGAEAARESAQAGLREAQDTERRATVARDAAGLEAERVAHDVQFRGEQLAAVEAELGQLAQTMAAAEAELAQMQAEQATAETNLRAASERMTGFSVEAAAAEVARWQTAAAVARRALQDAQARASELERGRAAAAATLADRQSKIHALGVEINETEAGAGAARDRHETLRASAGVMAARLKPIEAQVVSLEVEQERVESGDAEARANLHATERRNAAAQLEHARKHEEVEGMRRRIEEDFGLVELDYGDAATGPTATPLPLYPVVEKLEAVESLPEGLEDQLNRKRGQLRRMGLINPDAEREYLEVKERHEFLTTQVADLESAQTQLREVIAEMDVLMERDFRKTFDAVANEFRDTFTALFGGGTARLMLTDPEHMSTTGVDIQARLPGRRPQSLAMLSGGERSLTACALVFALLRVSPTPFCVLDEVDAMLDEANVGRYRDMLNALSKATQFIIVTHNRNTVQVAETVYGITMGADSASQVIGLKLEEALAR
jgi:chromosome segregation protein